MVISGCAQFIPEFLPHLSNTGQIIGATNSKGEHPTDRPLTPNDLWATVYRHLGIDHTDSFPDYRGRPMPILPFGEPIGELLRA